MSENIARFFVALSLWATYDKSLNVATRNEIIRSIDIGRMARKQYPSWKDACDVHFGAHVAKRKMRE